MTQPVPSQARAQWLPAVVGGSKLPLEWRHKMGLHRPSVAPDPAFDDTRAQVAWLGKCGWIDRCAKPDTADPACTNDADPT